MLDQVGIGVDIGDVDPGSSRARSPAGPWYAQQRGVDVVLGRLLPERIDGIDSGGPRAGELDEPLVSFEVDSRSALLEDRRVADEVEAVAQPLLGDEADAEPGGRESVPGRLGRRLGRDAPLAEPPLVLRPSPGEVASGGAGSARLRWASAWPGAELEATGVAGDRLVEPAQLGEGDPAVVVGVGVLRLELDRPVVCRERLLEPAEVAQVLPRLLWASA